MKKKTVILGIAPAVFLLGACARPQQDPQAPAASEAKATPATKVSEPAARTSAPTPAPAPDTASEATAAGSVAAATGSDADVDKAIDASLGDHAIYRKVIEDFQKAVVDKDAQAASALVHYPISVDIDGKNRVLRNEAAFVENYERFMTPEIAQAITGTRYGDAFVNYKGVMLGRGEAWINGICKDDACKNVDVKVVTLQSTSDLSP
jgi:hypothetical protein